MLFTPGLFKYHHTSLALMLLVVLANISGLVCFVSGLVPASGWGTPVSASVAARALVSLRGCPAPAAQPPVNGGVLLSTAAVSRCANFLRLSLLFLLNPSC